MTLPSFDLSGRVALVTGASGGLGRHFAELLAQAGAAVALGARRQAALARAAAAIASAGGRAMATRLDVTDAASVEAAFDAIEAALGPVDILVNNAGIASTAAAETMDLATWATTLDTNLSGAFRVAQALARRRIADRRGAAIVNIASISGIRPAGAIAAYAASKAGLLQLTASLALEWARHGIRVNALAPGYIATELNADFLESEAGQALVRRIPQRRLGRPQDLDGALLLLVSDAARYITGATLAVDGGHLVASL